ncbi:hypothetical protein JCGZ_08986 [Jatropha curcas]|uniref:Serine protease n=1 Tax=Jatropha curcas TaxID=180498 RepID=A0A067KKK7_JATCU|nr:hypothetical protein JCGZ_08986 [Jatropha curcas]
MVKKQRLLIALAWLLVVASIAISANATAAPRLRASEDVVHPQGFQISVVEKSVVGTIVASDESMGVIM